MSEQSLTKNQIISELTKSPHGELSQYTTVGLQAAREDSDFYGHLIAWNDKKGVIRDAKVALPIMALTADLDQVLSHNALAHIAKLDPRNLVRAVRFSKSQPIKSKRSISRIVERYLREREDAPGRFMRAALQHKSSLKELYALLHIKPGSIAQDVLFDRKKIGVFKDVADLKNMSPQEIAETILNRKIPFLVASGALGIKMKDPLVVQALISSMSATELVTNSKMLERLGLKTNPALRAAYEEGLKDVQTSKSLLKTTRAAEVIGGSLGEKLKGVQEKQLDLKGVEGDWLILADKSGSMESAINVARQISALLARVAKGNTFLIFYDTTPQFFNVTGMEYDKIQEITSRILANGGTSPGCALRYAFEKKLLADGIVLISDMNENSAPPFETTYREYTSFVGKELPIYAYQLKGDQPNLLMLTQLARIEINLFQVLTEADYHSIPNMIQTMRTNRYSLVEEIMETPFLTLEDVFKDPNPKESSHAV